MSGGEEEVTLTYRSEVKRRSSSGTAELTEWVFFPVRDSHSMWLLELADLLDMVHKVSSVYILHHKVQPVLEHTRDNISTTTGFVVLKTSHS